MVYGFLMHSTDGSCTTYLCSFYGAEGNDSKKALRRNMIVSRVEHEIAIRNKRRANLPNNEGKIDEEGIFWVPCGELFSHNEIVLWHQIQSVAYVLICDEHENRMQANHFLQIFPKELADYCKFNLQEEKGLEFFTRLEEAFFLLQSFLPNGQLLFTTPNFIKHLRKEVETINQLK
eukprot:TRINITY_DN16676_c0_g1_i1.p1 TRINITY_DN16676_c0_g1~~TRINITY_DN16676_c0_g1_i1.p1  ORF type:complete len:176 (+),score=34.41 TRINITY_DN16676_c0_g1_i1:15-542(+)